LQKSSNHKFNQFLRNSASIPFPERIIEEFAGNNRKIEEEEIEDETGNVSESIS
jgi:biotin carboxylase